MVLIRHLSLAARRRLEAHAVEGGMLEVVVLDAEFAVGCS
jgi:hypothetical protein